MRKLIGLFAFLLIWSVQIGFAQTREITGTVIDKSDRSPIPGVSVVLKGNPTVGDATNSNGRFSLRANDNDVLVFSFIGMKTVEIPVNGRSTINVEMESTASTLDEFVVVGYGTSRKVGTVVGTVSTVSTEILENKPVANVMDALQGQVAGLQVFTSSGEPSAVSSMHLRGVGSLTAGNSPLYVLDGIPVTSAVMNALNPSDFESVTILKDASSTSIYGSRAANGVVYITTKSGRKAEQFTVRVGAQYGISSLANKDICSPMNAQELLDFQLKYNVINQRQYDQYVASGVDTKWVDYYFNKTAPTYQINVDFTGGSSKTSYYISGSYYYQDGIVPRSEFERYTFRSNVDSKLKDWLQIGTNLSASYSEYESSGYTLQGSSDPKGAIMGTISNPPYYDPYDENGKKLDVIPGLNIFSPEFLADKEPSRTNRILFNGMAYVQLTPIKGLTIRSQAGMEAYDLRNTAKTLPSHPQYLGDGATRERFARNVMRTITNTIEYKWDIDNIHNFTILGGHEGIDNKYDAFAAQTSGQNDDRLTSLLAGTTPIRITSTTYINNYSYAYLSFFGRLDYSYNNKYFADFSVRNDASSRFGKDNRSASFFSGGLMWNLKNEEFLAKADFLSNLRLKFSVGSTGNSDIGNYDHLSLVGVNQYNAQGGWYLSSAGNPELGWETQILTNLGFDVSFADNRYRLEFAYYTRKTKDMLMDVPVPHTSGAIDASNSNNITSSITSNIGEMKNSGIELDAGIDIVRTKDWFVGFKANYAYNKNKITKLFYGYEQWDMPNYLLSYKVGEPVQFFAAKYAGVDPMDGAPMWYIPGTNEVTKDYDSIDDLAQATGVTLYAPHSGGFSLSASWKGIMFETDFTWVKGKHLVNNDRYFAENPYGFAGKNQSRRVLNMWEKPGDITDIPAYGNVMPFCDYFIEDASFLRMKNISLGYQFPESLLNKQNLLKGAKVYVSGRNLLTATKYLGADPEINSNLTYGAYPNTKQFTFGAEITF